MKRSQSATELLVLLVLIIIIAIIVVSLLGGMPQIGVFLGSNAKDVSLATMTVGVTNYAISDYDTFLKLKNNYQENIRIDELYLNGNECTAAMNLNLPKGGAKAISCIEISSTDATAEFSLAIVYTDLSTGAQYSQNTSETKLAGQVAEKYVSTIDNHASYDPGQQGCWNTTANPHPICTCVDLNRTKTQLSWNYELQNSIDFVRCNNVFGVDFRSGSGWDPIGSQASPYSGTLFNGSGYTIKNLRINRGGTCRQGLIGVADNNLRIDQLGVIDVDITGSCRVGGLLGEGAGSYQQYIDNSYTTGSVSGTTEVGGLAGFVGQSDIINSYSEASVTGSGTEVGGLLGEGSHASGSINNSYATGQVVGTTYTGGLVGTFNGVIDDSYATGDVSGTGPVGGFAGNVEDDVSNSYATGDVTGTGTNTGGFIGYVDTADIDNSYATGVVAGSYGVGGFIGRSQNGYVASTIDNSYTTSSSITGTSDVGGLIGNLVGSLTITSTTWQNNSDNADDCIGSSGANPAGCTIN